MIKLIVYTFLFIYVALTILAVLTGTLDVQATLWAIFNLLLGIISGKEGNEKTPK